MDIIFIRVEDVLSSPLSLIFLSSRCFYFICLLLSAFLFIFYYIIHTNQINFNVSYYRIKILIRSLLVKLNCYFLFSMDEYLDFIHLYYLLEVYTCTRGLFVSIPIKKLSFNF